MSSYAQSIFIYSVSMSYFLLNYKPCNFYTREDLGKKTVDKLFENLIRLRSFIRVNIFTNQKCLRMIEKYCLKYVL